MLAVAALSSCAALATPVAAQGEPRVQEMTGRVEPGRIVVYRVDDLEAGQRLYARTRTTSGNLDPILGVVDASVDLESLMADSRAAAAEVIADGGDTRAAIDSFRDAYYLAWDEDSGGGLQSALEYLVPSDGAYRIAIGAELSSFGRDTFGDYVLTIGVDAPDVLQGTALPTGDEVALLDAGLAPVGAGVEEVTGALTAQKSETYFELRPFDPGDTVYVRAEGTSGDLRPTLILANFADKPVAAANLTGQETIGRLEYTVPGASGGYRLRVTGRSQDGNVTAGDFKVLVGVNEPDVLTGRATTGGRGVVRHPIEVQVGLVLEQIIDIDQQNEFFTGVAVLRMEWQDPALAFNPEDCQCATRSYTLGTYDDLLELARDHWPTFTLQNQQGNRWVQNREVEVGNDGSVLYRERFTTNFQVDFDFRQYPFDRQTFAVRVDSVAPEERYSYAVLDEFSGISPDHGEDEFILQDVAAQVSTLVGPDGDRHSRYTFEFDAPRHLSYYVFQIFVPILLIIVVSWVTFFLKDYGRRIEVASANLLLFIAFSWSLSDNYPRLGYLTFLDAVMAIMFVINALVVMYNVVLRRMEMNDRAAAAERIDSVLDWAYPLLYIGLLLIVVWQFR